MILQLGGFRLVVEPVSAAPALPGASRRLAAKSGAPTPAEWQAAEAEVEARTRMPFEPPSAPRTDRVSFAPRVGGKYHALTGTDVEIARVVARDGALWVVVDVHDRPVVLKRVDFAWRALPRDRTPPIAGDVILHDGRQSTVAEIVGEAEVGGWAVRTAEAVALHVIRGEARHWISLGVVELDA